MLTFNDASVLLGLCNIPVDIQHKILLLFIGLGTPISDMIKKEIMLLNNTIVTSNEDEDSKTLWRYRIFLKPSPYITGSLCCFKNLQVLYELRIAYLSDGSNKIEKQSIINVLTWSIKNNKGTDLFQMFYGFDKYDWVEYPIGTQTSIIVHNAIQNKIINEYDPTIYYAINEDDKYY